MRKRLWIFILLMPLAATSWLLGCSGDSSSTGQPAASSVDPDGVSDTPAPAPEPEPVAAAAQLEGLCALLPPADIEAAFANKFTLGITAQADSNCQYEIPEVDVGQFIFQLRDRATYDLYKSKFEDPKFDFRYLDGIGQEAILFNNGQVEVLLDDDGGFSLTLIIVTFGKSPVSAQESTAAMEQLARAVADRL